jgi:transposase InsO family protein
MSQRYEFVVLAGQAGANIRELCRRFGVSRKTGYKWMRRYRTGGAAGLVDRSRRPQRSPGRCREDLAAAVIEVRQANPTWGGRKLRRRLLNLGHLSVPAASTCTQILRRATLLSPEASAQHVPLRRFERAAPNELWQTDFKGEIRTQSGAWCHPFTVLDDHSRFNIALEASADETGRTVQAYLTSAFTRYGLPEAILCDNGAPWGGADLATGHTALTVWLLRLGVRVLHGRPYHPQTQGKEERFHRTLNQELLLRHTWIDLAHCAREFPTYRDRYNCERPHASLDDATPVSRYRPSPRAMPASLSPIEYAPDTIVRTVRHDGVFAFAGHTWLIGRAFVAMPIGLRPSPQADGHYDVYFSHHLLGHLDLTLPAPSVRRTRLLLPLSPPYR